MKKENYSEYVKNAYEFYAVSGCPDIITVNRMKSSAATSVKKAELSDLEAVAKTFEHLSILPDGDIAEQCLRIVYLHTSSADKGTITARVRYASERLYISENSVYRILKRCREITARLRGLRVE